MRDGKIVLACDRIADFDAWTGTAADLPPVMRSDESDEEES